MGAEPPIDPAKVTRLVEVVDRAGAPISPRLAAIAILHRPDRFSATVMGSGFFVTRYGLFATAAHVFRAMAGPKGTLENCQVLYERADGSMVLRNIQAAYLNETADVALGQAHFSMAGAPNNYVKVSATLPNTGDWLSTYSYPQNAPWNFAGENPRIQLRCDFYHGDAIAVIDEAEAARRRDARHYFNQTLQLPIIETTLALQGGGSGSPVFNSSGAAIGVFSSGWGESGPSYVVPISRLFELAVPEIPAMPPHTVEDQFRRLNPGPYTLRMLGDAGHFELK